MKIFLRVLRPEVLTSRFEGKAWEKRSGLRFGVKKGETHYTSSLCLGEKPGRERGPCAFLSRPENHLASLPPKLKKKTPGKVGLSQRPGV